MDSVIHNNIVSFIWGIADDCLRDVYSKGKRRDIILPMTVIRRLDTVLEETKQKLTNPDYIEYIARGKYLVTKEGEQVFKFPSSEDEESEE